MKHTKQFVLSIVVLIAVLSMQGQPIEKGSFEHLSLTVFFAAEKHDVPTSNRRTEFILMFLEIDSNGKVSKIHLMDDEENRDSSYAALKKVKPEELKEWNNKKYKNKILILPIESFRFIYGEKERTYLEKKAVSYLPQTFTNNPSSDYILMPKFHYTWRGAKGIDESRPRSENSLPKVEKLKQQ